MRPPRDRAILGICLALGVASGCVAIGAPAWLSPRGLDDPAYAKEDIARIVPVPATATLVTSSAPSPAVIPVASPAAASTDSTIYVSASGNDSADGKSQAGAVKTLERARDIARTLPAPRLILMSGDFRLSQTLMLSAADSQIEWRGDQGGATITPLDTLDDGIVMRSAHDVTFSNFAMRGFGQIGIDAIHATRLKITGLHISDIHTTDWHGGAIHMIGNSIDVLISDNRISDVSFGGIVVSSVPQYAVKQVRIVGNQVWRSCTGVNDCGAIYISGKSRADTQSVIADNIVFDYGPPDKGGRGIYIDDWASGVTVRGNCIGGRGVFGIQLHGGHNNLVTGNFIDARQARSVLLNQTGNYDLLGDMSGNRFENNQYLAAPSAQVIENRTTLQRQSVTDSGNTSSNGLPARCAAAIDAMRTKAAG